VECREFRCEAALLRSSTPPLRLEGGSEVVLELLLQELTQVLLVHGELSESHLVAALESRLVLGRVQNVHGKRIELTEKALKWEMALKIIEMRAV
jgi:hypothetical protein